MNALFSDFSTEIRDMHEKGVISCKHLWTLFPRNMVVYSRRDGYDRLFRVTDIQGGYLWRKKDKNDAHAWILTCQYLQFNGLSFGVSTQKFLIDRFEGLKHITSLPAYPVGFHSDANVQQRVVNQARKVIEYQALTHCEYSGTGRSRLQGQLDEDDEDEVEESLRFAMARKVQSIHV
jgi:hypothetical protein